MKALKPILFLVALIGLIIAGRFLPILEWVKHFAAWVAGAGWLGVLAFFGLYVAATVLGLPALPLTLAAGVIWGPLKGTLIVSPSSVAGASLAFLLGRTLLRDWVKEKTSSNARFAAMDEAVGREGWRMVALLRLSPVFPFNLLNYALGASDVGFWPYVLASWIAMLPGTFLFVSAGSALGSLANLGAKPSVSPWLLWVGLGATLLVTLRITRVAKRALAKSLPTERP
jgi:uncharacterized membrane protein YdjX (TVP38/TMEM64 family)